MYLVIRKGLTSTRSRKRPVAGYRISCKNYDLIIRIQLVAINDLHPAKFSNEEFLTCSRSRGYSKSLSCVGEF